MKKTLLSLAIAAGMAASSAAMADATVYGLLHVSLDDADTGASGDSISMSNQTSAIGVKGSEDLGNGLKAFFKAEFQLDPSEIGSLKDRDQYIGLKGGMGTVKLGTVTGNYKAKGGSVDPMYRTALEGRGDLNMQSPLHGGAGRFGGRLTDAVQYSSPKMGGMQMVINTTFDAANTTDIANATPGVPGPGAGQDIDETIGVGFRYEAKAFSVYVDYIDVEVEVENVAGDTTGVLYSESATKIGGTFTTGPVKLGVQLEQTEDLIGSDYMMVSANYSLDKNNGIYFSYGTMDDAKGTSETGTSSFALMYNHNMSKNTNVYVGYGDRDDDATTSDDFSVMTAGMRVKF